MLDQSLVSSIVFIMNRLDTKQRVQILRMLVEGHSLRATAQMANVSRNTVDKLLQDTGEVCLDYQDRMLRNLHCERVQCNAIWSFVYSKQKNISEGIEGKAGDDTLQGQAGNDTVKGGDGADSCDRGRPCRADGGGRTCCGRS